MAVDYIAVQFEDNYKVEQLRDGTLSIVKFSYQGIVRNLVVPSKLYGVNVSKIGNAAFSNGDDIFVAGFQHYGFVNITIPNGIMEIGNLL